MSTLHRRLLLVVMLVLGIATAFAQDTATIVVAPVSPTPAPVAPAPAEDETTQLEEIIVTASGRAQSVLKIPIAVTEVNGERLQSGTIRDARSLQMEIPSLNVTVSGSDYSGANIRMRGIGTGGSNAGFEGSVGIFVDGVFIPRPGLALGDLLDIDRIEVLRGPQGTLFGKNTSVGAISIFTKKPSDSGELDLTATYGNFNTRIARMIISGPVIDDVLGLRLAAQYNVADGFIENRTDGESYNNRKRYLVRAQALLKPSEFVSLRLLADKSERDERCCATPYTRNDPVAAGQIRQQGGTVFEPPSEDEVAFDAKTRSFVEDMGVSAELNWDLSWAQARGLLSYRESFASEPADGDKNDLDISYVPVNDSTAQPTSTELSLHSSNDWLDWLLGAYYSKEDIGFSQAILLGEDAGDFIAGTVVTPVVPVPGAGDAAEVLTGPALTALYAPGTGQTNTQAQQEGTSFSIFTHNIVQLPWDFEFTLGVRYLTETKEGGGFTESNSASCRLPVVPPTVTGVNPALGTTNALRVLCAATPYQTEYKDDRYTGTTALGKNFDGGSYLYGSYSTGFKAGGINLNPPSTGSGKFTFDPETVEAYELGLKIPFFDRRLQSRTAVFNMDFEDFQINSFDGFLFTVSNAAEVNSRGVETELTLTATDYLRLRGAATYAETTYGEATRDANLRGKQLTNAPKWVGQLGADFREQLPWWGMELTANVVARYQSEVNTGADLDPSKVQKEFTLINTRLGLNFPGDFEFALWGANVTDEFYNSVIFNAPSQRTSRVGSVGAPRTFGLDIRKKF